MSRCASNSQRSCDAWHRCHSLAYSSRSYWETSHVHLGRPFRRAFKLFAVASMVLTLGGSTACKKDPAKPPTATDAGGAMPPSTTTIALADAGGVSPKAAGDASTSSSDPRTVARDLNILVISIDSLRADMPWNGYERPI